MLNNIGAPGLLFLLFYVIQVVCFFRIMGKAGYTPLWGLLSVIPLGALVLLLFLAFSDWPAKRVAAS